MKICIVDDNVEPVNVLRMIAKGKGIEVTHYTRGAELLKAVREGATYDCIVLDVVMPGMSGPELFYSLVGLKCPAVLLYYSALLVEEHTRLCMISKLDKRPLDKILESYEALKDDHIGNLMKMAVRSSELCRR